MVEYSTVEVFERVQLCLGCENVWRGEGALCGAPRERRVEDVLLTFGGWDDRGAFERALGWMGFNRILGASYYLDDRFESRAWPNAKEGVRRWPDGTARGQLVGCIADGWVSVGDHGGWDGAL